jgi:hypothetical protein
MTKKQQKTRRKNLEARRKAEDSEARFREELNRKFRERLETSPEALKFREALRARTARQPESPLEFYISQLEDVRRIYEDYARKDITTMSPNEREEYRYHMDTVRWARSIFESDRPLEENLLELKFPPERDYSQF